MSTRTSVRIADRLARWVITGGGLLMVGALVLMFVLILLEAIPLWSQPRTKLEAETKLEEAWRVLAAGENEYRELADLACADGVVRVIDLRTGQAIQELRPDEAEGLAFASATRTLTGEYALGLPNGSVLLADGRFTSTFDPSTSARVTTYRLSAGAKIALDAAGRPLTSVAGRTRESGLAVVAGSPEPGVLLAATYSEDDGAQIYDLSEKLAGEKVAVIALDDRAELLAAGTASGKVLFFSFLNRTPEAVGEATLPVSDPAPITAARYLLGGQTLVAGDAKGRLVGIQRIRRTPDAEERVPTVVQRFEPQGAAITALAASSRGKTFLSADAEGDLVTHFATNERTLTKARAAGSTAAVAISPKADGYLAILPGRLASYELTAHHPETSLHALFGKVHYEGYDKPEYNWQSTGGTDDFESKLSLVPLVFGTLKGTLYAMLFAVPVALAAALYTSMFAHRKVKALVKPVVELMAALPSVVIGFVAGLFLSPLIEKATVATLLLFPAVPVFVLIAVALFGLVKDETRKRLPEGTELMLILSVTALAVVSCAFVGPLVETVFFGGDFKAWLLTSTGLKYDTRNSLVISFAMGFAVIPIIFTISEDALSSVPEHLKAASLALGASRWQTAIKVILPTASAGIFSAVMVGFGRAVGETMIVLMATGNTPIMEWSLFNGMRTLAANIAVEIPEAPHGGTLYRVLFLGALLLFLLTFLVNTAAEVMRQRLRKKYSVI
ncbi:MAG: ABC transporter permease subunit [Acidobacteria bacterium]|nr:ABC transporter permease subunit [Acidobacteriota bacterium]